MTIYEHAMVGINGALALGLARRHGRQIVAWAGAALLPDFGGLTICPVSDNLVLFDRLT